MSVDKVNRILNNENELLQELIKFIESYKMDHFEKSGIYIAKSWANFLNQRSKTNQSVSGTLDNVNEYGEIKTDMEAESAQLQKYIDASETEPVYSEEWEAFFRCEREILCELLKKLDEED